MKFNLFGRTFSFLADTKQQEKAMMMIEKYILKPEIVILLTILAIFFIVCIVAKIKKNEKLLDVLRKISPWMYLFIILGITVLNRTSGEREIRLYHDVWLTPTGFHESNVLGFAFNTCLYIPFGYLLYRYLDLPKKLFATACIIFCSSVLIEAMQYVLARGVSAIDDLIANTLGGLIGLGFAVLLQKFECKKQIVE